MEKGLARNSGMCTSLPINIEFDPSTNSLIAYTERTIEAIAGSETIKERIRMEYDVGSQRFIPQYGVRELVHMPETETIIYPIKGTKEKDKLEKQRELFLATGILVIKTKYYPSPNNAEEWRGILKEWNQEFQLLLKMTKIADPTFNPIKEIADMPSTDSLASNKIVYAINNLHVYHRNIVKIDDDILKMMRIKENEIVSQFEKIIINKEDKHKNEIVKNDTEIKKLNEEIEELIEQFKTQKAKLEEQQEVIKGLHTKIQSQHQELKSWSAGYNRDGRYLRWRDDETLKWQSLKYSYEFIQYRAEIGLYFTGDYTDDGMMIFKYPNEKTDEMYPEIFEVLKTKLGEGDAEILLEKLGRGEPEKKIIKKMKPKGEKEKEWKQNNLIKIKNVEHLINILKSNGKRDPRFLDTSRKIAKFLDSKRDTFLGKGEINNGSKVGHDTVNRHLHYYVAFGIVHRKEHGTFILPTDPEEYEKRHGKVKIWKDIEG